MASADNAKPAQERKGRTIIMVCTISNIVILHPSACLPVA
jgi:hypothetical protein